MQITLTHLCVAQNLNLPFCLTIPVSYTHLDVYKRQAQIFHQQACKVGGFGRLLQGGFPRFEQAFRLHQRIGPVKKQRIQIIDVQPFQNTVNAFQNMALGKII